MCSIPRLCELPPLTCDTTSLCFISVWRLVFLIQLHKNQDKDFSYVGASITYWSVVELNAGIICACLMTLKPLAAKLVPRLINPPPSSTANGDLVERKISPSCSMPPYSPDHQGNAQADSPSRSSSDSKAVPNVHVC